MKYALHTVADLHVFDSQGNLVTVLDASKDNLIQYLGEDEKGVGYIGVNNAVFDTKLLKFIADSSEELSDYERSIKSNGSYIELGGSGNKECKLICYGLAMNPDTNEEVKYKIEAPKAEVVNQLGIKLRHYEPADFDMLFKVLPYNENKSLFKLHI